LVDEMRFQTDLLLTAKDKIVSVAAGKAVLGGASPIGIVQEVSVIYDIPTMTVLSADSCEVATSGECSVSTSTCVAGDWFTSDGDGLAVKVESGFALGRILQNPVDGLALCVVGPVIL
jgi:hypothetical protein